MENDINELLSYINKKEETAFDKTGIQKNDVCMLWAYLGLDLICESGKSITGIPVIGSLKMKNKISNDEVSYECPNKNCIGPSDLFHVVVFIKYKSNYYLVDFSSKYYATKNGVVSAPYVPVYFEITEDQYKLKEKNIIYEDDSIFYKFDSVSIVSVEGFPPLTNFELITLENSIGLNYSNKKDD